MYFTFTLDTFPNIHDFYTVTRNTIWSIADKNCILIIIVDGCCNITCNNESYTFQKGDVCFIPANTPYSRKPVNDTLCTMTYIHFSIPSELIQTSRKNMIASVQTVKQSIDNAIFNEETFSYPDTIYLSNKFKNVLSDSLQRDLDKINLFSPRRPLTCHLQSQIALSDILVRLSQANIETLLSDSDIQSTLTFPPKLKRAIQYIKLHAYEHISLDDLAEYCSISKQQLIRYFKSAFNTTPNNYITDYKIAKAKECLFNNPELAIQEIAFELGFSTQYYFTNVFTKITGETPSGYRQRTMDYLKKEKEKQSQQNV